jgi:hypothetical protein
MTSDIKYKKYNKKMNFAGNLEARSLVSGAITALVHTNSRQVTKILGQKAEHL